MQMLDSRSRHQPREFSLAFYCVHTKETSLNWFDEFGTDTTTTGSVVQDLHEDFKCFRVRQSRVISRVGKITIFEVRRDYHDEHNIMRPHQDS